jgi:hypothetical protein
LDILEIKNSINQIQLNIKHCLIYRLNQAEEKLSGIGDKDEKLLPSTIKKRKSNNIHNFQKF